MSGNMFEDLYQKALQEQGGGKQNMFEDLRRRALEETQAQGKPLPSRGVMGDIGAAVAAGTVDAVEMAGRVARTAYPEFEPLATPLVEKMQHLQATAPLLQPSQESQDSLVREAIYGGVRSAPASIGLGLPGALVGSLGGPAGAVGGFVASGGTMFGLAQYDQFREQAMLKGVPPEIANSQAIKAGFAEGSLEAVSNAIDAVTFKLGRAFTTPLKATLREMLEQPASQTAKAFGKNYAKALAGEVPTEMAQSAAESHMGREIGLDYQDPWTAAKHSIGPTAVMTAIFGGGATGINAMMKRSYKKALTDPQTDMPDRLNAAHAIAGEIAALDKQNGTSYAEPWIKHALGKIVAGQAIDLDTPLRFEPLEDLQSASDTQAKQQAPQPEAPAAPAPSAAAQEQPPIMNEPSPEEIALGIPDEVLDQANPDEEDIARDVQVQRSAGSNPLVQQFLRGQAPPPRFGLGLGQQPLSSPQAQAPGAAASSVPGAPAPYNPTGMFQGGLGISGPNFGQLYPEEAPDMRPEPEFANPFVNYSQNISPEMPQAAQRATGPGVGSTVKQPWAMTRAELTQKALDAGQIDEIIPGGVKIDGMEIPYQRLAFIKDHKKAIERALSEGKPVPPEVLADYPELKKGGGLNGPQVQGGQEVTNPAAEPTAAGPETNIVASFKNEADGVTVRVARLGDGRFSVTLKDDDSGEVVPHAHIYKDQAQAEAKAQEIAGIKPQESITENRTGLAIEKFIDPKTGKASRTGFIIKGDRDMEHAPQLRKLGGVYNVTAKGYVFNNKKRKAVNAWIGTLGQQSQEAKPPAQEKPRTRGGIPLVLMELPERYIQSALAAKGRIEAGSPGKRGPGLGSDGGWGGYKSTYPDFFKGKNYTKAKITALIDKLVSGERYFTPQQKDILHDIISGERGQQAQEVKEAIYANRERRRLQRELAQETGWTDAESEAAIDSSIQLGVLDGQAAGAAEEVGSPPEKGIEQALDDDGFNWATGEFEGEIKAALDEARPAVQEPKTRSPWEMSSHEIAEAYRQANSEADKDTTDAAIERVIELARKLSPDLVRGDWKTLKELTPHDGSTRTTAKDLRALVDMGYAQAGFPMDGTTYYARSDAARPDWMMGEGTMSWGDEDASQEPSVTAKSPAPAEAKDLSQKSTGELVTDIFAIINDHIGNRGSFSMEPKKIEESLYQKLRPYLQALAERAKQKALDIKAYLMGAVDSMPDGPAKSIYELAAERYIAENQAHPEEPGRLEPTEETVAPQPGEAAGSEAKRNDLYRQMASVEHDIQTNERTINEYKNPALRDKLTWMSDEEVSHSIKALEQRNKGLHEELRWLENELRKLGKEPSSAPPTQPAEAPKQTKTYLLKLKTLSKDATAVFLKLVERLEGKDSIKIGDGKGFMAVHVDRLYDNKYSIAHYYTQNGDLMSDPRMEFIVENGKVYPVYFRQDGAHGRDDEVLTYNDQGVVSRVNEKMARDLATFANQWMKNIDEQQGITKPQSPAKAQEEAPAAATPAGKIADRMVAFLEKGKDIITNKQLFEWADEAYGGTQAEGKYTPKDAYDAMELGINLYLLKNKIGLYTKTADADPVKGDIVAIKKSILSRIPTQANRTQEVDSFQQFSTPPTLALVANWAANIQKGETYLEPSAGVGGLAVYGKIAGAHVLVNELSERRLALLKELGFDGYYHENAEQLNNILPKDVKPTVIVMNPPFSASAGRVSKSDTMIGAQHIEQALKRLAPGGRLVAIVGRGMADGAPAFKTWWNKIKGEYNVRANIGVDGNEYRKYGTTFDTQILVIDKTTPQPHNIITGRVEKVDDLVDLLMGVRNDRTYQGAPEGQRRPVQPGVQESAPAPGQEEPSGDLIPLQPATGDMGSGAQAGSGPRTVQPTPELGPGRSDVQADTRAGIQGDMQPGGLVEGKDTLEAGGTGEHSVQRPSDEVSSRPAPVLGVESRERTAEEEASDTVFSRYQPHVTAKGAKPHPANLVESAAMAAIDTITPSYTPSLPQEVIDQGKVSDIQLEAVIFAGQAHSEFLPGEDEQGRKVRRGYFIGDGTGVGKGREIAAILWDNWNQGRKKAVWISKNSPLINDARRDAKGVGWGDHLFDFGKVKMGTSVTKNEGIAFLTYDTLKTDKKNEGKGSRLDQLVEWLGEDFDGVIAFDESHCMANAVSVKGKRGTSDPSRRAIAGMELQKRLPNARVVYVSATGATEVMNLAYATRLGLWGARTAFAHVTDFIIAIKSAGLSAMELVARDLKSMGLYCARSLSYHDVKYDRLEHELSPEQREIYDELAGAWQIVLDNINQALELTGIVSPTGKTRNGKAKSSVMAQFWGNNQRFWNQILTSMQMPSVIKGIENDLAAGHSVVLQLVNTNEAEQKRAIGRMEEDDVLEDLDMTPRQALMAYVQNAFPVNQFHEVQDDNGNIRAEPVLDSQGNPVINAEAEALRDELLTKLGGIRVPDSPLEMILDTFGVSKVAEVTGRTQRVVIDPKTGKRTVEKRSPEKCTADANAFNAGKKRILFFSDAGGTGRSFHAGLDVDNQSLRRHYLVQPGWRADNAVQGFGRTHRSNQRQAPEYILVCTDLKGHKRFLSSIARRLDQLGALTKGQRQTASQGFFAATDNLESAEAAAALEKLIHDLSRGAVEGLTLHDFEAQTGIKLTKEEGGRLVSVTPEMPQFLNRLLNMKIDMQGKIFDEFARRHEAVIARAMADGTLDMGMETLHAKRIALAGEQVVHTDQRTGAETKHVELDLTHDARLLDFDRAQGYAQHGFYRNKTSGRIWAVGERTSRTDTKTGAVYWQHGAWGANYNRHDIKEDDLNDPEKYELLTAAKAREVWEKEYDALPKEVTERVHLITGVILPLWDRLKTDQIRIKRAFTGGQSYLGQQLLPSEVKPTLDRLGASASKIKMTPEQVFDNIMNHRATVTLANGWRMVRKKVSGDQRIELIGPSYTNHDELRRYGVIIERITWETRLFIPTERGAGVSAIKEITETRPVMSSEVPITARASSDAFADHLDDDRYRMGTATGATTTQAIKDAIAKIREKWVNAPEIHIVENAEDLPEEIKDQAPREAKGRMGKVQGVYHRGKVYLVAEHIADAEEAQRVLLHEVRGHLGMRAVFGKDFDAFLDALYGVVPKTDLYMISKRYKLDLNDLEGRRTAVDEYLAKLAENPQRKPSLWQRVVSWVRGALRKMGFIVTYTEAEIRELILSKAFSRADRFLAGGERRGKPRGEQTTFSMRAPVWHSQLERVVAGDKFPNQAPGPQMAKVLEAWAKDGTVKAEELDWTGVADWLKGQLRKVSRQEVLGYIAANNVQVQEIMHGKTSEQELIDEAERRGDWVERDRLAQLYSEPERELPTKYHEYTLPGGKNYRELLLTFPGEKRDALPEGYTADNDAQDGLWRVYDDDRELVGQGRSRDDAIRDALNEPETRKTFYRSSHWDEPNILAHVRFNERTDADGKRVLFIEEIQSDWHQEGREKGYGDKTPEEAGLTWRESTEQPGFFAWFDSNGGQRSGAFPNTEANKEAARNSLTVTKGVPDAPFKKTWPMLAMKRMVRYAAENGFDRIAWTTGEQQAERYDLSHHINEVAWTTRATGEKAVGIFLVSGEKYPQLVVDKSGVVKAGGQFTGKPLSDVTGKEIAQKILGGEKGSLTGLDLKIGGEGMKGFYDLILPAEVNKFFGKAKWGNARVGKTQVDVTTGLNAPRHYEGPAYTVDDLHTITRRDDLSATSRSQIRDVAHSMSEGHDFQQAADMNLSILSALDLGGKMIEGSKYETAHSLDITPEMREKALGEGMPMFRLKDMSSHKAIADFIEEEPKVNGKGEYSKALYQFKQHEHKQLAANGAMRFISRYRSYTKSNPIIGKHGHKIYFQPDPKSILRLGQKKAYIEYALHSVTSTIDPTNKNVRVFDSSKYDNLDNIDRIIKEAEGYWEDGNKVYYYMVVRDGKRPYGTLVLEMSKTNDGLAVDDGALRYVTHLPSQKESQIKKNQDGSAEDNSASEVNPTASDFPQGKSVGATSPGSLNIIVPTDGKVNPPSGQGQAEHDISMSVSSDKGPGEKTTGATPKPDGGIKLLDGRSLPEGYYVKYEDDWGGKAWRVYTPEDELIAYDLKNKEWALARAWDRVVSGKIPNPKYKRLASFPEADVHQLTNIIKRKDLFYRIHGRNERFHKDLAFSSLIDGSNRKKGYSSFDNPEDLIDYWNGNNTANRSISDDADVVIYSGKKVGTGGDGEPLSVPDMKVVYRTTWKKLQSALKPNPNQSRPSEMGGSDDTRFRLAESAIDPTSLFEDVEERRKAAKGIVGKSLKDRLTEAATRMWHSWSRHFPNLTPAQGNLINHLRLFEEIPNSSKAQAADLVADIIGDMNEAELDVFTMNLVLPDLIKDIDKGILREGEKGLPFGYQDKEQIEQDLEHYEEEARKSDRIMGALAKRKSIMDRQKRELVDHGLLDKAVLDEDAYYHHQVLEVLAAKDRIGTGTSSGDVRLHTKGWQRGRVGSIKDFNTDYVQAEFEVLSQGIAQLETKKTLDIIDREANIKKRLERDAKEENERLVIEKIAKAKEGVEPDVLLLSDDPFLPFRQSFAMGLDRLCKMAANGTVWAPMEFTDCIDWLAVQGEITKANAGDDVDPADLAWYKRKEAGEMPANFWKFLSYLLDSKGGPGSGPAAQIFKSLKDKEKFINEVLGESKRTYKSMIPDGYVEWKPAPGTAWYLTNSLTDKVIEQAVAKGKTIEDIKDELRKVLARGMDTVWVIPEGLAHTMDNFRDFRDEGPASRLSEMILNMWKQWVLLNPLRVIKYNVNNFSGDFDICLAYDPKIVSVYGVQAFKDLWAVAQNKDLAPGLKYEIDQARRMGVIGSGMTVHDIPDITKQLAMDKDILAVLGGDKLNLIEKWWAGTKKYTVMRENVLRLAAWRYFKARVAKGENVYGASTPAIVDKIKDPIEKAAHLARELVGDYGNLSEGGQWMRRKLVPFYSWIEINAPRYVRLFKNLPVEGEGTGRAVAVFSAKVGRKAAVRTVQVLAFYTLVNLWNMLFFPDEEDELDDTDRRQMHLILGRRDDGSIFSIRIQGALSDLLSWFGAEDLPGDIKDVAQGKKSLGDKGNEALTAPISRMVNSMRPFEKTAAEAMMGKSMYPDAFRPRPIRDKLEHILGTFSLDMPYRHIAGKPTRNQWADLDFIDDILNLVGYTADGGEQAYYATRSRVIDYLRKQGKEPTYGDATNRSNALYYYRQALKYGDLAAAKKYLDQYAQYGGTRNGLKTSIKNADPLHGIGQKERRAFLASLSPEERQKLQRAQEWYKRTYLARPVPNPLRSNAANE